MPTKLPAMASLPSRVKATEVMSSGNSVQICDATRSSEGSVLRFKKAQEVTRVYALLRNLHARAQGTGSATSAEQWRRGPRLLTFHSRSLQSSDPERKKRSSLGWKAIDVTKSRCCFDSTERGQLSALPSAVAPRAPT